MQTGFLKTSSLIGLFAAAALLASPVFAAPPPHAGKGNQGNKGGKPNIEQPQKGGKPGKAGKSSSDAHKATSGIDIFFRDDRRDIIRDYYSSMFSRGHCPPGLAKKNNGCLPPGQAKKWRIGHPLPHDVIFHDLPDDLLRRLGRTEEGYRLVRVGADILKIGVGTGLVVEAVEDLGDLF